MNKISLFALLFFCTFFALEICVFADDGEKKRRLRNLELFEQEIGLAVQEAKELSDEVIDLFLINTKYDTKTVNDCWDQITNWISLYRKFIKDTKFFYSDDFVFMDKLQRKITENEKKILKQISDTLDLLKIVDKNRNDYLAEKKKEMEKILSKDFF